MMSSAFYYDGGNRGQGERFLKAAEEAEAGIRQQPLWGQPYAAATRRWRLKKFPCDLINKDYPDRIRVFAVAHFSRKPGYWIDRL
jgi:hypothetical protein